jgi:polyisoprenoid-binding protein YceI
MKLITRLALPLFALSLAVAPACGKKAPPTPQPVAETKAPEPAPAADAAAAPADAAAAPADAAAAPADAAAAPADAAAVAADVAAAGDAAPAGDAVAAADGAAVEAPKDYIRAVLVHAKGENPVTADFEKFEIIEANIDLTKLEEVKAVIAVELGSVLTGDPKRDGHVKSPDFFDIEKFAKATITVKGLKAVENTPDTYDATATLDLRGVQKDLPVQFKVVEKLADAIIIEGEVKGLARADWQVGGEPEKVNVGPMFDAQVRLTVKNVVPAPPAPEAAPK